MTTATNEPTGTIYDHVRELPDVLAELGTAHLQAAAVAAELDLDHARLWEQADGIVSELSLRLAVAQSRLLPVLDGATGSEQSAGRFLTAAYRSARRARTLGAWLQRLLRSAR